MIKNKTFIATHGSKGEIMTNEITVKIEPLDYCLVNQYDEDASLSCVVYICFEPEDGVCYEWGANEKSLLNIISVVEDFFEGRIIQDTEIRLLAPWHMGKLILYPNSFYIDSKSKTWTYRFKRDEGSEDFDFVYPLGEEQLRSMYKQLKEQYRSLHWDLLGKLSSYTFDFPERPFEWCYSAEQLRREIESLAKGNQIKAVFVSAGNYIDPLNVKENFVNYFCNSEVLIQLENCFIDLEVCARGLFMYRFFDISEASVNGPSLDFIRGRDSQMCEIQDAYQMFKLEYKNSDIKQVTVDTTDYYPWVARGFDKSKLGDTIELPENLNLKLANGNTLSFHGRDDDFAIKIESSNN